MDSSVMNRGARRVRVLATWCVLISLSAPTAAFAWREPGDGERARAVSVSALLPSQPNFTAELTVEEKGHKALKGLFARRGWDVRLEPPDVTPRAVVICRLDAPSLTLFPDDKTYVEGVENTDSPFCEASLLPFALQALAIVKTTPLGGEIAITAAGEEVVDGHPCTRLHVTLLEDAAWEGYLYLAKDLANLTIRLEIVGEQAGRFEGVYSLSKIRLGAPAEMFEPPAGYRNVEVAPALGVRRTSPESKNRAPVCTGVTAERLEIAAGERVDLQANASDPDGDVNTYTWTATGGRIVGGGSNVAFDATGLSPGAYTITAHVDDGFGHGVDCSVTIKVH